MHLLNHESLVCAGSTNEQFLRQLSHIHRFCQISLKHMHPAGRNVREGQRVSRRIAAISPNLNCPVKIIPGFQ